MSSQSVTLRHCLAAALMAGMALAGTGCLASIGAEGEMWMPRLDVGASTNQLSKVDLNVETDIDAEQEFVGSYKTWIEVLSYRFLLDSFHSTITGNNPVQNPFNFDGIAFNPGDVATSNLDFTLNRFNFEIRVPDPFPGFGLYAIIGVDALDIDMTLVKESTGETGQMIEHIPLLTVGVRAAVQVKRLELFARVQAIESEWVESIADLFDDVNDLTGFYFDGEAGFRIWWGDRHYALTGGYRFYDMDLEFQSGESADLLLQGPFVSIQGKLP